MCSFNPLSMIAAIDKFDPCQFVGPTDLKAPAVITSSRQIPPSHAFMRYLLYIKIYHWV